MTDLVNLIYGSSAPHLMTDDELLAILTKAREKNAQRGITGMLLYRGGNFLQVLEGEKQVVGEVFDVIAQDPRHHSVQLFAKRVVKERSFGEWEMGFVHLDPDAPIEVPGYNPFLNESLNSERFKDLNFAYTFLRTFRDNVR